jgi:hypothetical protein
MWRRLTEYWCPTLRFSETAPLRSRTEISIISYLCAFFARRAWSFFMMGMSYLFIRLFLHVNDWVGFSYMWYWLSELSVIRFGFDACRYTLHGTQIEAVVPRIRLFNPFFSYEQEQKHTQQTGVDYTYSPNALFTVLRASLALMFVIACSRTKIIYFSCVMEYLS